ncbi:LLM class flavin-dependent oxidoreductase [Ferruginibacter paludis]|uniref:LLM class flavin-dependent oxidoreductase n=1 Tax=Ferruginibacter paludis TaxID=1310417 RepID=UPI0025B370D0|nr:LLM class flavin-dependent oxidoreductase [Ferruginibacter paludis]MDN3657405.1 LLM class flavin-dependent oxidoreductase [Ferruginibacter paludis]
MQNNTPHNIDFSVLDLATIKEGDTAADSFHNSLRLAKHTEQLGYSRYWVAEHHNMPGVASSATSVLIGYLAAGTNNIRVGSGGIMLPNHAPLIVAEQFGTLASLYPGRIDLGLGRAPGTDQVTAYAIRGENIRAGDTFAQDIQQLQQFFSANNSNGRVRAIPGEGLDIPIWILGSSTDSALLAAALGLPYAFASHFAPAQFLTAIDLYRKNFRPSGSLASPYVISCVNVIAADTDAEAARLATSLQQMFFGIISGRRRLLQPPVDDINDVLDASELAMLQQMLGYTFVGGPEKIKDTMQLFLDKTKVDEVMAVSHIYDQDARLHSYGIFAEVMKRIMLKSAV